MNKIKIALASFLATLSVVLCSTSCMKDEKTTEHDPSRELALAHIAELDRLTDYAHFDPASRSWWAVISTLAADAAGAYEGAQVGGQIGVWAGNPALGAAAGGVVGAVIGSSMRAYDLNHTPVPPGNTGTVTVPAVSAQAPYDAYSGLFAHCGYFHNLRCEAILSAGNTMYGSTSAMCDAYGASLASAVSQEFNVSEQGALELVNSRDLQDALALAIEGATSFQDFMDFISSRTADPLVRQYNYDLFSRLANLNASNGELALEYIVDYVALAATEPPSPERHRLQVELGVAQYSAAIWLENHQ